MRHCCSWTVSQTCSFTVLHCCSLTVVHWKRKYHYWQFIKMIFSVFLTCCSLTVEHCCSVTVSYLDSHFSSLTVVHWNCKTDCLSSFSSFNINLLLVDSVTLLFVHCVVDRVTLLLLRQNVKIFSLNHREETYVDRLTLLLLDSIADLLVNCLTLLVLHSSALKLQFNQ